jgi:hypothetical protein
MVEFPDGPEIALPSGDVTEGVVRIGDTVRRPRQPTSPAVAAYLRHLAAVGFSGAPRYLGTDARGRDVLDFVAGDVPGDPPEPWAASDDVLPGVGRLVRSLHDASEGWRPGIDLDTGGGARGRPPTPASESIPGCHPSLASCSERTNRPTPGSTSSAAAHGSGGSPGTSPATKSRTSRPRASVPR